VEKINSGRFKKFLSSKMFMLLILLVAVVVLFTVLSGGSYLTLRNIKNIFNAMSVVAILTVGAGCLLISGQVDLSTGGIGTIGGIILALLLSEANMPWPFAVLITFIFAALMGAFNALLINKFKLQGFISTMAMASICQGMGLVLTGTKALPIKDSFIVWLGTGFVGELIPVSVILAILIFIIYGIIISKTKFGRSVYLVGGNPQAAALSGIDPQRISYILFINNAVLGALAGIVFSARMKSAQPGGIITSQFASMTAAILGGISFGGGAGGMGGAFVGLLILNAFNNGMSVLGAKSYWATVASGALLIVALTMDFFSLKSSLKK
jgi:ribose/xylose/arabinose/galactoside ABC-type transport system permease subunit